MTRLALLSQETTMPDFDLAPASNPYTDRLLAMLQPFCARPSDPREWAHRPIVQDGRLCATSGVIAVMLDATDHGLPESSGITAQVAKLIDERVAAATAWHPVGELPEIPPCPKCEGTGKKRTMQCPDCDGEGSFWHGQHTYDCQHCDGDGWVYPGNSDEGEDGEEVECEHCDGLGLEPYIEASYPWLVGTDRPFIAARLLSLVSGLPRIELGETPDPGTGVPFRFSGGSGAIAPMRPRRR